MSEPITEKDISLGYASEPDEYASEHVQEVRLEARPFELYVGNTGKVCFEQLYKLFSKHGAVENLTFWRTHNHLYHARINYHNRTSADKAVSVMNNQMVCNKRIRVTYARAEVDLDFTAAVRIDDISADVTEEDIFDHFRSCGDIRFVIKTGYAAYIQFTASSAVAKAFELEMILNGDPYTLSRISADDAINHIQVIENMKDIKYRKPFVMVENYPELPKGTPLCRYKSMFESVGPVRHFKIAPTGGGTVTLALCLDKADDRNSVIDRFNGTVIGDKRLKLYMASSRVRMKIKHVAQYAICKNSIVVERIRPYYKEYDICMLFSKCGSISFLEQHGFRWIICFDNPSTASLALSTVFTLFRRKLKIQVLNQQTLNAGIRVPLQDPDGHSTPSEEHQKPNEPKSEHIDEQNLSQTTSVAPLDVTTKQQSLVNQAEQNDTLFAARESVTDGQVTPDEQPIPPTSHRNKRPASSNESTAPSARGRKNPLIITGRVYCYKFLVTIGNLPKNIEENDLRELFSDYKITNVSLFCNKDLYFPTSVAYLRLISNFHIKAILRHHHDLYRGNRLCIQRPDMVLWLFMPERSIMLKNLSKNSTEEDITEILEKVVGLKVVDFIKPAHHYAYVDFTEDVQLDEKLLSSLRNALMPFKIDVFPLYRKLPKIWMGIRSLEIKPIEKVRPMCGAMLENDANEADKEFGVHNAHKLFVGNIPRDTESVDVIDYFNNFGNVVDYIPIEKKSCYLRKSAILSFEDAKHAQNAYCQQPHFLEGSALDVHLMDTPLAWYGDQRTFKFLTVKFHSPFLTNDEIQHTLQQFIGINHHIRLGAFDDRCNFVVNYRHTSIKERLEALFNIQYINDEAVKIVEGYDPTPPTEDEAREKTDISNSPHRQQKENYLSFAISKERFKVDMEVTTRPNKKADIPFTSFYNDNSVQINNVSLDTTLEDIRDLFVKCGDIVDYRALHLEEDATKICYVKFKIDLAAELACTYNQRMINGKRILVHLATETLHAERDRSVLVEQLSPSTTAEQLHDAFTPIGVVKYVQKQSPFSAIVCFKDEDCMREAVNVTTIPNSESFVVSPCSEEYDPRLFNNFASQEELIPIERMRAALKPRMLPEFHQLELRWQALDTLPDDIKTRLINEVLLAREQLPNFNILSKHQQIDALKTKYQDFTQKGRFLRLHDHEQEKLLDVTSDLQRDYSCEEKKDLDLLSPAPKKTRKEKPASPSVEAEPTPDSHASDFGPQQKIEPLVTGMIVETLATTHFVKFPRNNEPRLDMPPSGGRNLQSNRGRRPGSMMDRRPPVGEAQPVGGGPPDSRLMQRRLAALAYNGHEAR